SNTVEFNTGDNNGENFHVNSGARFMKYVYFNDYCRAQGWLTYSTLSKKTNIKKLDTSLALDKIRQDDQYLYEYKRNVAKGVYDPQASFIIDDVNDVSHYSVPREFIDQTGKYREPSVELSYLIAAFQEIDKQVQTQKEEIKELKEKLQHE
ncbi:chromosome partitioning protein ParA, partial [Limosilactobacillus reuteri]|nr:chromosome partitioning protein ParA [Limosilactobacillus reuteri]